MNLVYGFDIPCFYVKKCTEYIILTSCRVSYATCRIPNNFISNEGQRPECVPYNYFPIVEHVLVYSMYARGGRRGSDCMVVGFTTTFAISGHHH